MALKMEGVNNEKHRIVSISCKKYVVNSSKHDLRRVVLILNLVSNLQQCECMFKYRICKLCSKLLL